MQSTFNDPSRPDEQRVLLAASRDSEFLSTVQTLAAGLPVRVEAADPADPTLLERDRGVAAVIVDRRGMLGLGGSVVGRPTPAPPVLCILDGAEGAALEALRRGAWDVLVPPFEARDLQRLIGPLAAEGIRRADDREQIAEFYERLGSLTEAENEVMEAVCDGKLNKQIARELNVSIRTVEQRRRRVFTKMNVPSAVPLACRVSEVRTIERLSRPAALAPPADPSANSGHSVPPPNTPLAPGALNIAAPLVGHAPVNQPC